MSPTTETCACGASITVDVRDGLVLGFRLAEWRKEHRHDLDAAYACRERDEAHASMLAARKEVEAARAEVEKARAEIKATNGALARGRASAAAVARVLNLCNEKPECAHGLDCHCDCLAVADVRAAADTNRPIDEEEDTP